MVSSYPVYIHGYNITIVGHSNLTVICVINTPFSSFPRLVFLEGRNIKIKDITWVGCGYGYNYVSNRKLIHFRLDAYDVLIHYCKFLYSGVQDIHIDYSTSTVTLSHCNFMYHSQYSDHGAAIEYTYSSLGISRPAVNLVITIIALSVIIETLKV